MEFQSDQPTLEGFLSNVIGAKDTAHLSPFTECIILATICGRSISHRHQAMVERLYGHTSQEFWDRQQWLDNILTRRIQALSLQYFFPAEQMDPMLLFTVMLAHASFLHLTKTIEPTYPGTNEHCSATMEYETRSLSAAREIVHLLKALPQLSCFRVNFFAVF